MHKAKTISQSVVLVDPTYKGLFPQQMPMQPIQFENIFTPLANELWLKTVMNGINGFRVPTQPAQGIQMAQDFVFGDFVFSYNVFPPKFIIKHNSTEKEDAKIKEVAKKIVTLGNLGNSLGAVGFNYEMSIDNEENKINLKNALSNPSIVDEFNDVNATLAYKEGEMILNLTIADAIINGKKVIFIGANFHNDISATNRFESIMEKDFRGIVDKKLNAIFDKK
jgi:hypothetical protein